MSVNGTWYSCSIPDGGISATPGVWVISVTITNHLVWQLIRASRSHKRKTWGWRTSRIWPQIFLYLVKFSQAWTFSRKAAPDPPPHLQCFFLDAVRFCVLWSHRMTNTWLHDGATHMKVVQELQFVCSLRKGNVFAAHPESLLLWRWYLIFEFETTPTKMQFWTWSLRSPASSLYDAQSGLHVRIINQF